MLIQLGALGKADSDNLKEGGQGRGPLFRLPSMSGQSNFAFVAPPCRHEHLRAQGYMLTPPTSFFHERFLLSLGDLEGLQVISQVTPPRLLRPLPPMPVTTSDETTLQQGSWEAVELLAEQKNRK